MKNKETLDWILKSIHGKKHHLVVLTLIQVFIGVFSVLSAFLLKYVTHGIEIKDESYFLFSFLLLLLDIILLVLSNGFYRFLFEYAASDIENSLKRRMYQDLLFTDYGFVKSHHKEDWINRISEDTRIVTNNILSILPAFGRMSVQLIFALALILFLSPIIGYVIVPVILLLLLLTYFMRKRLKRYHKDVQEKEGNLKVFLSESLEGLSIVHSFVKEDMMCKLNDIRLNEHKMSRIKRNNFSILCSLGFIIVYYASFLFGIFFCGMNIINGIMDLASLTSIVALLSQIQSPISQMTSILPHYYTMIASGERLRIEKEEKKTEVLSNDRIKEEYDSLKEIRFDCISFSYPQSDEKEKKQDVFSSFSLSIEKGEHIALVGHSGCGKSTLLKLLLSLYPLNQGKIVLDFGSSSRKIEKIDRNLFGYVPQENLILKGTIRDVVTFYDPDVDEERLIDAYKKSMCYDFIMALPKKDLTMLQERGSGLSIGQLQRLSLARAYYSEKPILLLDEVTSALDEACSKEVIRNLFEENDKTILFVTHHKEDLPSSVRIIELGDNYGNK